MGYVIYVDILFIMNFIVNYILLFQFGILMKKKKNIIRFILGSIIGALGSILFAYKIPVIPFLFGGVMLMVSYSGITKREMISCIIYFFSFHLLIGGCLSWLREQNVLERKGWQVIGLIWISTLIFSKLLQGFYEKTRTLKNLYSIEIQSNGITVSGIALLDTGNQLYDPFFHRPVMLGEEKLLKTIYEKQETIQWIPFHSIGKDHGMIPAIKVERLRIHGEKKCIEKENVLVAVKKGELSSTRQYQFLLHEELMTKV